MSSNCLWYLFLYLKNVKIHIHVVLLWSILVCKIPECWGRKLWHQSFVPFDSENIRIKESEKPGFTFSVELRNKFVWTHGLKWSGDGSLKVKTSEHIWQPEKWLLQLFEIGFKNQKKILEFPRIFDNPLAKYLISKVSWMHWLYF